jgi:hypothetical protein
MLIYQKFINDFHMNKSLITSIVHDGSGRIFFIATRPNYQNFKIDIQKKSS